MYDHVGLNVSDLSASVRFYKGALSPLGHVVASHDASGAGIGPKDAPALWLYANGGRSKGKTHVAFSARDGKAVDRFHADGLAAGGRDNGAPGIRADYGENYYAAFLIDPDGNNVEAVFLG